MLLAAGCKAEWATLASGTPTRLLLSVVLPAGLSGTAIGCASETQAAATDCGWQRGTAGEGSLTYAASWRYVLTFAADNGHSVWIVSVSS